MVKICCMGFFFINFVHQIYHTFLMLFYLQLPIPISCFHYLYHKHLQIISFLRDPSPSNSFVSLELSIFYSKRQNKNSVIFFKLIYVILKMLSHNHNAMLDFHLNHDSHRSILVHFYHEK